MPVEFHFSPPPKSEGCPSQPQGESQHTEQNPQPHRRRVNFSELHNQSLEALGRLVLKMYGVKLEEPETKRIPPEGKPPNAPPANDVSSSALEQA